MIFSENFSTRTLWKGFLSIWLEKFFEKCLIKNSTFLEKRKIVFPRFPTRILWKGFLSILNGINLLALSTSRKQKNPKFLKYSKLSNFCWHVHSFTNEQLLSLTAVQWYCCSLLWLLRFLYIPLTNKMPKKEKMKKKSIKIKANIGQWFFPCKNLSSRPNRTPFFFFCGLVVRTFDIHWLKVIGLETYIISLKLKWNSY